VRLTVPRLSSHSGPDNQKGYRTPEAIAADEARDPLPRLRAELLELGLLEPDEEDQLRQAAHARALAEADRLKTALLSMVSHDFRTPLTSIKASVTTLLDDLGTPNGEEESAALDAEGRREMLDVIDEETDRLNRFVEGLVEMARIEAGEMRLRRRWGSIEEIVGAALERAAPLTRGHEVLARVDGGLPAVRVDARAVTEVVYTLVDNAAKYSPAGTRIEVRAEGAGDGRVRLSVEDEGPGIPPELRGRVFDKFFRAMRDGDSRPGRPTGTGMGLAIAKGIAEAHGGRIWVEDGEGGRGSRVVVTLPIGDEEEATAGEETAAEGAGGLGVSGDERQAAHTGR
jgi:two-component system sensor histidine kinase KdpD